MIIRPGLLQFTVQRTFTDAQFVSQSGIVSRVTGGQLCKISALELIQWHDIRQAIVGNQGCRIVICSMLMLAELVQIKAQVIGFNL